MENTAIPLLLIEVMVFLLGLLFLVPFYFLLAFLCSMCAYKLPDAFAYSAGPRASHHSHRHL